MLTDDTHSAYAGEDYEKVLIRAMLAISNLMSGGDDATAYSLQTDEKQERIIQERQGRIGQQSETGLQADRARRVSARHVARSDEHGLQRRRAKLRQSLQLGAVLPLRPLRLRPRDERPSQREGQRRAVCLRARRPRPVQGTARRNSDAGFDADRRPHHQRHGQAHAAADDRAGESADRRRVAAIDGHARRGRFGQPAARRRDGHDYRRHETRHPAIRRNLSPRDRPGGRATGAEKGHRLRREGRNAESATTRRPIS